MTRISRSATQADLDEMFGPRGLLIGAPVRPEDFVPASSTKPENDNQKKETK